MYTIISFILGFVSYIVCYTIVKPVTIAGVVGTLCLSAVVSFLLEAAAVAALVLGAKK